MASFHTIIGPFFSPWICFPHARLFDISRLLPAHDPGYTGSTLGSLCNLLRHHLWPSLASPPPH